MKCKQVISIAVKVFKTVGTAVGIYALFAFAQPVRAALTARKLDDGLYYIEYHGNDGFGRLMKNGGIKNPEDLSRYITLFLSKGFSRAPKTSTAAHDYGCSTLTASTEDGRFLMGRNFDYPSATGMILHEYPRHGYESVSTFNVEFYGFGEGWKPEGFKNGYLSLSGLFFALDGINEKGLAVADLMAGDDVETHQDTGKPALTTTSALRYILNKAATVEEALGILRNIDMNSDIGSAHHYAIADASGRSVVVEYVNDRMTVIETPAVANHYLCPEKKDVGLAGWDHRYEMLCHEYEKNGGVMEEGMLLDAIRNASQPPHGKEFLGTAWTMLMDLTNPSVTYYSKRHFDTPFHFELSCRKIKTDNQ